MRACLVALFLCPLLALASPPLEEIPGACKADDFYFHTEEGGCLHFGTGLVWSMSPTAKLGYEKADGYCQALSEGGKSNWRLPTSREMLDVSRDRRAFNHFEFQTRDFFWAKTPGTGLDAWMVELAGGEKAQAEKGTATARAVCVRAPEDIDGDGVPDSSDRCNLTPAPTVGRPLVHTTGVYKGCAEGDQEVSPEFPRKLRTLGCKEETEYFRTGTGGCVNLRTGLEWSRVSEVPQPRKYADRYCDSLREGIQFLYNDWVLPNRGNLDSISGQGMASRHFKFSTSQFFWSSSFGSHKVDYVSLRPFRTLRNYDEIPQILVNLQDGSIQGIPTLHMNYANGGYDESLDPANEDSPAPVICVRRATTP